MVPWVVGIVMGIVKVLHVGPSKGVYGRLGWES